MGIVNIIQNAVNKGWASGVNVGIIYLVTKNGDYIEGLSFPHGSDVLPPTSEERGVMINISVNACKSFTYIPEHNEFVYDVSIKGKPFLGNIPPHLVVGVLNLDTGESLLSSTSEPVKETSKPTKLTLVSFNSKIVPSKSKAQLQLL